MNVAFEYDGEMSPDTALNKELLDIYPFCNLTEPANILIMPGLHSAIIASKLIQELGGGSVIGPVLSGLDKSAQIYSLGASVNDIMNLAAIAASKSTQGSSDIAKKPVDNINWKRKAQ